MSWLDNAQQNFTIITGDGKSYTFSWMKPTRLKEYNATEFNYLNLDGSYVYRTTPKGYKYALELYFIGDNHLDQAEAFQLSADNRSAWKVSHPYYGNLTVQPISMLQDDSEYNVTKFNVDVIATITQENPITVIDPVSNIGLNKDNLDIICLNSLSATPSISDVNTINTNNAFAFKKGLPIITIPDEAQNYYNLFNTANSYMNTAIASPLAAMQATQALINAPALFTADVQNRVNLLSEQFNYLRGINGINIPLITTPASKQLYQLQATTNLSSQLLAAANPLEGNYTKMADVIYIIDIITTNYNLFFQDLDALQTNDGGNVTSFIADANTLNSLNDLYNFTISSLFQIALNAAQQRSIILTRDSNLILLTHKFYGLDPFDANIDQLFINNGWGLDQLLIIKKGTQVNYYI